MKLDDLQEDPNNPRQITEEALRGLDVSLTEFGDLSGIVLNKRSGYLVSGHQRLRALREAHGDALRMNGGAVVTPTGERFDVRVVDWDETKARAANIAANSPLIAGEFTTPLDLQIEALTVDVPELVAALRLDELMGSLGLDNSDGSYDDDEDDAEGVDDVPFLFPQHAIAAAVEAHFPRFATLDELVARVITPPMALGQFNKLAAGKASGYWISALFNPHRLTCLAGRSSTSLFDEFSAVRPSFVAVASRYLAKFLHGDANDASIIKQSGLGWDGMQVLNEFRPWVARRIYLENCRPGNRVLDPCHGWGGRLLGFAAAQIDGSSYVGVDPETRTSAGCEQMRDWLLGAVPGLSAEFICAPFEDADLPAGTFDFAFTSPPYFDTEKYSTEATQSYVRFNTWDRWVEGFLRPLVLRSVRALKPGAPLLLNVAPAKGGQDMPGALSQVAVAAGLACSVTGRTICGAPGAKQASEPEPFIEIRAVL